MAPPKPAPAQGMSEPLLGSGKVPAPGPGDLEKDPRGYGMRIVNQLEKDLVALESIAAKMAAEGPEDEKAATSTSEGAASRRDGESITRGRNSASCLSPIRMGHCSGYNFVFSVPLPSVCTEEEHDYFCKKFLHKGKPDEHTFEEVIRHAIINPACRKSAKIVGECNHLKEARHIVIELILSFFESLSDSLAGSSAGAEVFKFTSEDCDELFVCVKISDGLAETLAMMGDYSIQLSASCFPKLHVKITDQTDMTPAFVNYDYHMLEDGLVTMYEKAHKPGEFTLLRAVDSMRLLHDKITDYIDLHELLRMGLLSSVYLGHNKDNLLFFHEHWANFSKMLWPAQPLDEIRDYFGEGVAFYFLFLGFLAKALLVLSPVALICSAAWLCGYQNGAQVAFCAFIIIWCTALLKFWRRHEAYYANKWGTDRKDVVMKVKDPVNPDFHGVKKPSPVDENIMELQADSRQALIGKVISISVTCFVLTLVIICVGINQWMAAEQNRQGNRMAGTIGAVVLSVQIQFWGKSWDFIIVDKLNHLEQHVTQYAYDQARVAKTFAFKFINTFYAFFYIAYIQQTIDPSGCAGGCKNYLVEQLAIVFLTYITFGLVDMGLPYAILKYKIYQEEKASREHGHEVFKLSMLEQQSKMVEYTGKDENGDYLQSLFPVAFVMLFGTMMPGSVFLAYLALSSQIRTHAWKLTKVTRRPFPERAHGIGIWDNVLNLLTYISVFNTIGLLVTQVDDVCTFIPFFGRLTDALGIPSDGTTAKLLAFFFLQNTAIIMKLVVDSLVSDMSAATILERKRQEIQKVRVLTRGHSDMHEEISIFCESDPNEGAFEQLPPLKPGDAMYVAPLIE